MALSLKQRSGRTLSVKQKAEMGIITDKHLFLKVGADLENRINNKSHQNYSGDYDLFRTTGTKSVLHTLSLRTKYEPSRLERERLKNSIKLYI